jgi:hypothetical protein
MTLLGYSKCPRCGYHAFDGVECFDCGYRARSRQIEDGAHTAPEERPVTHRVPPDAIWGHDKRNFQARALCGELVNDIREDAMGHEPTCEACRQAEADDDLVTALLEAREGIR